MKKIKITKKSLPNYLQLKKKINQWIITSIKFHKATIFEFSIKYP